MWRYGVSLFLASHVICWPAYGWLVGGVFEVSCMGLREDVARNLAPVRQAGYWPDVEISYGYRPKQSFPSILSWWSSDVWPVDSFWEQDGLNQASRTITKGERHTFWVALRWDFDALIAGEKETSWWQTRRIRTQERETTLETLEHLREKWLSQLSTPPSATALTDRIAHIAERSELMATYDFHCGQQPHDD